jgi:hypothetical protein
LFGAKLDTKDDFEYVKSNKALFQRRKRNKFQKEDFTDINTQNLPQIQAIQMRYLRLRRSI